MMKSRYAKIMEEEVGKVDPVECFLLMGIGSTS